MVNLAFNLQMTVQKWITANNVHEWKQVGCHFLRLSAFKGKMVKGHVLEPANWSILETKSLCFGISYSKLFILALFVYYNIIFKYFKFAFHFSNLVNSNKLKFIAVICQDNIINFLLINKKTTTYNHIPIKALFQSNSTFSTLFC